MSARSFRDRVAGLFKSRPNQFIDGLEIAKVGGVYAYRTRISDCRLELGMQIENLIERQADGSKRSYYRYVPKPTPAQLEMSLNG